MGQTAAADVGSVAVEAGEADALGAAGGVHDAARVGCAADDGAGVWRAKTWTGNWDEGRSTRRPRWVSLVGAREVVAGAPIRILVDVVHLAARRRHWDSAGCTAQELPISTRAQGQANVCRSARRRDAGDTRSCRRVARLA